MPSFTGYTPYTKREENRDRGDDSVFGTDSEDEAEDIFEGADFDFSIKKPARQLRQVVQEMKNCSERTVVSSRNQESLGCVVNLIPCSLNLGGE